MEKLYDMKEEPEKVILVAVSDGDEAKVNESLDELEELVSTAGAITVGRMTQNRERIHPGTYIGKGKIEKSKDFKGSMKRLLSNLKPWKILLFISLIYV